MKVSGRIVGASHVARVVASTVLLVGVVGSSALACDNYGVFYRYKEIKGRATLLSTTMNNLEKRLVCMDTLEVVHEDGTRQERTCACFELPFAAVDGSVVGKFVSHSVRSGQFDVGLVTP